MTDKVQKIREEVQRLQNELIQEKKKGFGSDVDDACILELQNVLTYIDSLQEEPVAPKVLEDMLNAKTAAESLGISQEEHDRIVDELIYGKEPELVDVDDLPNKEEEPVSEDLEEAAKNHAVERYRATRDMVLAEKCKWSFKAGAEWKKQQTISKACKWIEERATRYLVDRFVGSTRVVGIDTSITEDFRKDMEDE